MARSDPAARIPASPLLFAVGGVGALCAVDAIVKHLGGLYAIPMVLFLRYAAGSLFAVGLWLHHGRPGISGEAFRAHSVRALVILGTAGPFFWAVTQLPLAEVIAISFIAPLLVPFTARLILKERLRPMSLIAGVVGFVGVLIATRGEPSVAGSADRTLPILATLASAAFYSLSVVLMRARAAKDGAVVVGVLASTLPALMAAPFALLTSALPPVSAAPWFLLLGLCGTVGINLFTRAYARAEAQLLAPVEFTALAWAAGFGFLFWSEIPRIEVLAGAVVIIAACLISAREEHRSRQEIPLPN